MEYIFFNLANKTHKQQEKEKECQIKLFVFVNCLKSNVLIIANGVCRYSCAILCSII